MEEGGYTPGRSTEDGPPPLSDDHQCTTQPVLKGGTEESTSSSSGNILYILSCLFSVQQLQRLLSSLPVHCRRRLAILSKMINLWMIGCAVVPYVIYRLSQVGKRDSRLPPGPPTVPILGNAHQIPTTGLGKKYEPRCTMTIHLLS